MRRRSIPAELWGSAALRFEPAGVICELGFQWRKFVNKSQQNLSGVRVFVVEDEFAVLMLMEDMLMELGCELVGTASRMADAMSGAQNSGCDAAVLDVNINGEPIDPVAEVLAARRVPMVFSTGYGRSGIDARWREHPVLQKPYRVEELAAALSRALGDRAPA